MAMDMLNKLKSSLSSNISNTITNTVYSTGNIISGVLPGNPVTREYEVTAHVASAGPGLMWKIYSGYKKTTKQSASVFVLERAVLDRFDRQDKEAIWDLMKKGVSQLTRLRHPQILTVNHPLEESRDCLAFATEPVFVSLANALGCHENIPHPLPESLRGFTMFDVEIKYGLLQISEGLSFLHNSAKMLHRNICPESIIINEQGAWKICGFDYCLSSSSGAGQEPVWTVPEYDHGQAPEMYPDLDYTAPEYCSLETVSPSADMFSYGMLIFAVYNRKSLLPSNRNWGVFKRNCSELKSVPMSRYQEVPPGLHDYIKMLLSTAPDLRPSPDQIQQLPYFEDFGVKTLTNLDSQFQWDNLQKSQFYKGLPTVLPKLPPRVCIHRVFPCLAKEFVNPDMVPFVLPSSLQIADTASNDDFVKHILPSLKPVMKMMEPIQILLIFMQRMDLLLEKTPSEDIKSDVLPMVYRALGSNVSQIQELCLSIIPNFAGLLDKQSLKASLLPKIRNVCMTTTLLSVRVNSLICIGKLLDHMDKWQVIDDVLSWMNQIPSKEPAVIMAIVGIYKLASTNTKLGLTKEEMANKALPFLIPLSIENGLTVQQFNIIVNLVREMLQKIETEHRTKLEQLNAIQDTQKSSLQMSLSENMTLSSNKLVAAPTSSETSSMDSMFSGMGLGDYVNSDKSKLVNTVIGGEKSNSGTSVPKSSSNLSLQEKKQMMQSQNIQKPTQSPKPNLTNLPDTLNISWTKPLSSDTSCSNNVNKTNTGFGANFSNQQTFGNFASAPGFNNSSLPSQAATKPDLSAFDNLLSPTSSSSVAASRQPMNSLRGGMPMTATPMMLQPQQQPAGMTNNNNPNNTKQLSLHDINDLLS